MAVPRDSRPTDWTRTWVVGRPLSNHLRPARGPKSLFKYLKSCEMPPRVEAENGLFLAHIRCRLEESHLNKAGGGRKRKASGRDRVSPPDEHGGEGGPDEAVAFIAETVAELGKLAERHQLQVLGHLLGMARLEAEERLQTRSKRRLS